MLSAQAFVETDRAGRYLVQACRHFSNKGRHLSDAAARHDGAAGARHRAAEARHSAALPGQPGAVAGQLDAVAGQPSPAGDVQVEWSETEGLISFGWGRASLQATATTLVLRVEADSAEGLRRLQELLADHLQRFGRRAHLAVAWQPAGIPGTADRAQP